MGSMKKVPYTRIEDLTFRVYSDEEIEKISVIHVTNEESVNSLGHVIENGIYDLHMGPMNSTEDEACKTCFSRYFHCSGHNGHISLPLPVCNPFFLDIIREMLNRICPSCFRFQVKAFRGIQFVYECVLLEAGYDLQSLDVSSMVSQFLATPSEAVEASVQVDGVEKSNSAASNAIALKALEKELKRFFKKTKNDIKPSALPTCNSQSVYIQTQRQFLSDTRITKQSACMFCGSGILKVVIQNSQIVIKHFGKTASTNKNRRVDLVNVKQPYLTPLQAQKMLRECFKLDGYILKHLFPLLANPKLENPTDLFFMQKLFVIPPRHRSASKLNDLLLETDLSYLYKAVLRLAKCLRFLIQQKDDELEQVPEAVRYLINEFRGTTITEKSHTVWRELQTAVDNILDSELLPKTKTARKGIRQTIEKKFGLFRQNLMGKRVDYSARSVAAPDPMLAVDEVGVPMDFALKLSYPVPVTQWNVPKLRRLVLNGPLNYPGALMIEDEEGKRVKLKPDDPAQRKTIAHTLCTPAESCVQRVNATKIVYRHLQDGDYVLMNRQPTLHRPSIQAHRAKVMPSDRVLRLPYANCKAYNADFDGDEMNMHFPQNEMARSEACHIVTTKQQYLTPKDGSPLAGLIQDCVVASVMLTTRGKFFNKEDYQQLVYVALSYLPGKIRVLPPAILKPKPLWSGKQVVSTLLLNLVPDGKPSPSFTFKTTVRVDMWQTQEPRWWRGGGQPEVKKESMTESEFIVRNGELVCGVVDKCAIGSTSYGLVHLCYDLYGGTVASKLLTSVNRLCVVYLQWVGHTISLKEFVTPPKAAKKRRKALQELIQGAEPAVCKKIGISPGGLAQHVKFLHRSENEKEMGVVDAAYTSVLGPTTSSVTQENEKRLYRNNLNNRMRMMVDTGAKGSKVNMNQMASLFGSVAIDGKRMPMSITGKTLPSFQPYESNPRAGGYIPTRFVTGMDPKSYFFLCIVGRDSLQHTAVKTANSGYMQRCLIKHLEGIHVKYDMTVRNSDGLVLQFEYGEDGLDVSKVPFLRNVDTIDALFDNYHRCLDAHSKEIALSTRSSAVEKYKKKMKKCREMNDRVKRDGGFLKFSRGENANYDSSGLSTSGSMKDRIAGLVQRWVNMPQGEKEMYKASEKRHKHYTEPVSSVFCGATHLGIISEALDSLIEDYYEQKYSKRRLEERQLSKKEVTNSLQIKALNSRVDPGDAVGALCAQAIGEPLTQMTLNTFHFAGRDELNVTLGVPRMIEILRTASENIKTPIMEVPFRPHVTLAVAEKLKKKLTPVTLDKVLNKVSVTTSLEKEAMLYRRTEILFHLLPFKEYRKVFCVKPKEVLLYMEKFFFKKIISDIKITINRATGVGVQSVTEKRSKDADVEEVPEEEGEALSTSRRGFGEEAESSEDEPDGQGDDLGRAGASRSEKQKERDYSEDEDEENEMENDGEGNEINDEDDRLNKMKNPIDSIMASDDEGFGDEIQTSDPAAKIAQETSGDYKPPVQVKKERRMKAHPGAGGEDNASIIRRNTVVTQNSWIADYDFDEGKSLWCKLTLNLPIAEGRYDVSTVLQKAAQQSLVQCLPKIKKAFVVEKEGRLLLRTEGVNIHRIMYFEDILDINKLYTNNILLMAKQYGIEAAQRTIIKEIREVQSAYDIKVDFRHLSLLADYFTCEGVYKACSRHAINTCASPIQKMSYETCFHFMKKAVLQGMPDKMASPSANVMVGQPVKVGTNSMDILFKLIDNKGSP